MFCLDPGSGMKILGASSIPPPPPPPRLPGTLRADLCDLWVLEKTASPKSLSFGGWPAASDRQMLKDKVQAPCPQLWTTLKPMDLKDSSWCQLRPWLGLYGSS